MSNFIQKFSFIFIILIIVIIFHHTIVNGVITSKLAVSFSPDTQYILSVIEWNQYSLLNEPSSIYHLNYFYPNGYVTFYGHPLFGETLVFIILNNLAGISFSSTYNIYLLFSFWIGGIGVFLFARELLNSRLGGFAAAGVFIFFPHMQQIANILNIFSFFWVGFVLYFIVRFYREKKWKFALMSGMFIFLQGLFSIYHGFFLIAIFLPLLFLLLLLLRLIDLKAALRFAAAQVPFLILLVLIFHPFFTTILDSDLKRSLDYDSLVETGRLFRSNSSFYSRIQPIAKPDVRYFPGFISLFLFLSALTGVNKKKLIWLILLLTQFFIIYFLSINGQIFIPNLLLILMMIQILFILFGNKDAGKKEIRLFFMMLIVYFLLFFKFSTILGGVEFSIYGIFLKVVPSLSNFRFLYRGILVLLPIFSVIVASGLIKIIKKKKYASLITILFLVVLGFENYAVYNLKEMPDFNSKKYRSIKKSDDKVILELPVFKPGFGQVRNSRYTVNTRFHHNYYVNGRTAFRSFGSNSILFDRIVKNRSFPNKEDLKYLLENFSVDYVIFNQHRKFSYSSRQILERAAEFPDLCRIKDEGDRYIILELFDTNPQKSFFRKYSPFHLKNRKLKLCLKEKYTGHLSVSIKEGDACNTIIINDSAEIFVDFPDVSPSISGEKVMIEFDEEVKVMKIDLVKN